MLYGKTFLLQGPKSAYIQQKADTWRYTLKKTNKNRRERGVTRLLIIAEIPADNRNIKIL